jgi:TetR/AcrR family transcriptional regulator, regulator of cefoperazone and chloramphenicol sensitivity
MENEGIEAKERILNTVIKMLTEGMDVNKITIRTIAEHANVNSALINYYFQTKENLLIKAVEACMLKMSDMIYEKDTQNEPPADRVKRILKNISTFSLSNYALAEIAISVELKHGCFYTTQMIMYMLMRIYQKTKTDVEIKLMALQLIAPLQVILLNAKEYQRYLQEDIYDEKKRNELIDIMIDNILREA